MLNVLTEEEKITNLYLQDYKRVLYIWNVASILIALGLDIYTAVIIGDYFYIWAVIFSAFSSMSIFGLYYEDIFTVKLTIGITSFLAGISFSFAGSYMTLVGLIGVIQGVKDLLVYLFFFTGLFALNYGVSYFLTGLYLLTRVFQKTKNNQKPLLKNERLTCKFNQII